MPFPVSLNNSQRKQRLQELVTSDFSLGLNRSVDSKALLPGELAECLNFIFTPDGKLMSRPGLRRFSLTQMEGSVVSIMPYIKGTASSLFDLARFDETTFESTDLAWTQSFLAVDSEKNLYDVSADGTVTLIGNLSEASGEIRLVPFSDYVIVCDGSYLKHYDGSSLRLCYDDGDLGSMYSSLTLTSSGSRSLYSGGTTMAGSKFTTPEWPAGFTLPLTSVSFMLSKTGSPTGSVTARLYDSTLSRLLSTSSSVSAETLSTSATAVEFTFTSSYDIDPDTDYVVVVHYAGGSSSATVNVHYNTSANLGGEYYYTGSSWTGPSSSIHTLMLIKPGLPPTATMGIAWGSRLWIVSSETPGWVRYSNVNTPFDWSTADGGGYVGIVDDGASSYPVGALITVYGNLFVLGTEAAPYLVRLTGTSPEDFTQEPMMQQISCAPSHYVVTPNDAWILNGDGVFSLHGVTEYGDVRTANIGYPVMPAIDDYYSPEAFTGYDPWTGCVLIKFPGYDRVLVGHPRCARQVGGTVRYPWTEFLFNVTPTSFGLAGDRLCVGASDGYVYIMDTDYLDGTSQPTYAILSGITEMRFTDVVVSRYQAHFAGTAPATCTLSLYRNDAATPVTTRTLTSGSGAISGFLMFTARSIQFGLSDFSVTSGFGVHDVGFQVSPIEAMR